MPGSDRDAEAKQAIVQFFSTLSNRLWQRLIGFIGVSNATVCLQSVLVQTRQQYAFLQDVRVDDSGIHVDHLGTRLDTVEKARLQEGLLTYIDAVMALLTDLTGEVLVHKIAPLVQQLKHHLEV